MKKIIAIAAMDEGRVIGHQGHLPWNLSEDLKRFKELTMGQAVLMGRKTYESLPSFAQPLPGRVNVVLTRDPEALAAPARVFRFSSLEAAVQVFRNEGLGASIDILWIIGGEQVYQQSIAFWDELYLTLVRGKHEGDAFFPDFEEKFILLEKEERGEMNFLKYKKATAHTSD